MKKNIIYVCLALVMSGVAFSSCSDFLDADNKSTGNQTHDTYFKAGDNGKQLLYAAYSYAKNLVTVTEMTEEGTDLYINTRGKTPGAFHEYSLTAENSTVSQFYGYAYNMINAANGAIKYTAEDSRANADARFLRAWGHFLLSQQFGAVPYTTSYIDDGATRNYPRTPLADIYTNLITELTDLYTKSALPADYKSTLSGTDGNANKAAVAGLLAKVYLAQGWDIYTTITDEVKGTYSVSDQTAFQNAATWADKAINGTALSYTFAQKWDPANDKNNLEAMFTINWSRENVPGKEDESGHSLQNNFGGYYGNCTDTGQKAVGSTNQQNEKSLFLFEKGDERYEGTFMTTFYNYKSSWGQEGYYAYYNRSAADLATLNIQLRFYPWYVTDAEVTADLAAIQAQMKTNGFKGKPQAAKLGSDGANSSVTVYTINGSTGAVTGTANYSWADYNNMTENGVCVRKFDDPESKALTGNNDYRNVVVMSLSDIYLVAAEAKLMAGDDAGALGYINQVRSRAGLTTALSSFDDYKNNHVFYNLRGTTFEKIDLILDERARELYAEGQRWMDLRRTKQLVRYNVAFNDYVNGISAMQGNDGKVKWYRPIPTNEINSNDGITSADQNPGY